MIRLLFSLWGLLIASACAATSSPHHPIAGLPDMPASAFAEPESELRPEELRADLKALYEGLQSAHYDLYARRSKAAYDRLYSSLFEQLDQPMRPTEAAIIFQRFAAFGNVAHARIDAPGDAWRRYREAGGKALPIYPIIRDHRMYVAESYAPGVNPGDEIIAIEDRSIDDWLPRLFRNISGDNDYIRATLLELSLPSTLWTELGSVDRVTLTLRSPDGQRRSLDVETIDSETLARRTDGYTTDAFSLDADTRAAELLDGGIAYLRPGPFYSLETPDNPWDTTAFWTFIDQSFESFLRQGARALVIDMRQNPGGDSSFSDRMIAWFADEPFRFASSFRIRSSEQSQKSNQARIDLNPASAEGASGKFAEMYEVTPYGDTFPFEIPLTPPREGARFEGPVYAIVDRYSYSNAVNVAAVLQDYGFAKIIGEETADLPTTYGAMETFDLPHTGLTVGYPKAFIVRPSRALDDRGVVPDIAFETPPFAREDVVLQRTLEMVRQSLDH